MAVDVGSLTTTPLRNRLRVQLDAPPDDVWKLVGDLSRYPEYSAGLDRVDVETDAAGVCSAYVCHFKPMADGEPGVAHRETVVWYEPDAGYASVGEEPNAFELTGSVTHVTLEAAGRGTRLTWSQHYDAGDLVMALNQFDAALADIGANLVARFGGRVAERKAVR